MLREYNNFAFFIQITTILLSILFEIFFEQYLVTINRFLPEKNILLDVEKMLALEILGMPKSNSYILEYVEVIFRLL